MYSVFADSMESGKVRLCDAVYSKREVEVLSFLCNGRSHKSIANFFNISSRTVETHVRNIVSKSGTVSVEKLIEVLTSSGDIKKLNTLYGNLLFEKEFNVFLQTLPKVRKQVFICSDALTDSAVEFVIKSLSAIGCCVLTHENQPVECVVIFVKTKKDNHVQNGFDYIVDVSRDGCFLSILMFLRDFCGVETAIAQIERLKILVGDRPNVSSCIDLKRSEVMSGKGFGIALSGAVTLAVVGVLYGMYPGRTELITNRDMCIASDMLLTRADLLDSAKHAFSRVSDVNVASFVGIGGAGKTTLARSFIKDATEYDVSYELDASSVESLRNSYVNLADALADNDGAMTDQLKSILADSKEERRHSKVVRFCANLLSRKKKWVLIFDNLDDPKVLFGSFPSDISWGHGNVIITTRDQNIVTSMAFGNNKIIEVGALSDDEKYSLFSKITQTLRDKSYDKDDVMKLLREVPSYPLDVSTVACCLAGSDLSIDEYILKMHAEYKNFEKVDAFSMKDDTPYGKTRYGIIVTTLERILDDAQKVSLDLKPHLLLLSLCEPDRIPFEAFERLSSATQAKQLLKMLKRYSFISEAKSYVGIHRVVQNMWSKMLLQKMSHDDVCDFFDTMFSHVLNFDEVTYDCRAIDAYTYKKNFYDSMANHLKHIIGAVDSLSLEKSQKDTYKAKGLAIYAMILSIKGGNFKEIASCLEEALKYDEQYNIFNNYDRSVILRSLCGAVGQNDMAASTPILKRGKELAFSIPNATPLQIAYKIDECTDLMMDGRLEEGEKSLHEAMDMFPEEDVYWKGLARARLKLYIDDFRLQNNINNKEIASEVADSFRDLLKEIDADDLDEIKEKAKKDQMPKVASSIMVELVWAYIQAEKYEEAETAYKSFKEYCKYYPIAKYELRGDTYNVSVMLRTAKSDGDLKKAKEFGDKTCASWLSAGSNSMFYETMADVSEINVRLGNHDEVVKCAEQYPDGGKMQGTVQVVLDAKLFFNYAVSLNIKQHKLAAEFAKKSLDSLKVLCERLIAQAEYKQMLDEGVFEAAHVNTMLKNAKRAFIAIFGNEHSFIKDYVMKMSFESK